MSRVFWHGSSACFPDVVITSTV
ncbi:UNVERIFIED_CONTAM: hypothetical protein GTU68_020333 [Idotea baltica]|nr:hypothetical protein [Idotea baltica]